MIDNEYLIGIGKGDQARWGSREEPWTLPRLELYDVLCPGGTMGHEMSHTRRVGTGYAFSIEKDRKIGTVSRSHNEHCESFRRATPQRNLHGVRLGPAYAGEGA
ncbi:MAG: hypothetical protein ACERK0_08855 [Deltaproteobacteria bacterium]